MKAVTHRDYGSPDVLQCVDVPTPTPGDREILIKVRAASANPLDWHVMRGRPYVLRITSGLPRPKAVGIGVDVAGEVQAVGRSTTRFKPGDGVFGTCRGSFAEYACGLESQLVSMPSRLTFEQAAASPVAGVTALQGLRDKGGIRTGHEVLVIGAAGGVGTFAVQVAKAAGARVTGVCSTRNVAFVTSIGADEVVDYTRDDFARHARRYDLILDCVGNRPVSACRGALRPGGTCVMVGASGSGWRMLRRMSAALASSLVGQRKFVMFVAKVNAESLAQLSDLMQAGIVSPVIDRQYPLDQVPDAIRYLEAGHARGKVMIVM